MSVTLVSVPYIYPLCPLNFNHAKMFVVADVIARHRASKGDQVILPIAAHFSGNTAQATTEALNKFFSGEKTNEAVKTFKLHRYLYGTPVSIIKQFTEADKLLHYYTEEIFWELKSLNLSSDFSISYTTDHPDFQVFVGAMIDAYEKNDLLAINEAGDLALDYDDSEWRKIVRDQVNQTAFNQDFHKNNLIAAIPNIRNDWGFLRTNGYGVKYKEKWIIDPMFDSELFTLFDLYIRFKDKEANSASTSGQFFKDLFVSLKTGEIADNPLINRIMKSLPCDIFVGEEHLKNWLVKKFYAETKLLHQKFRTKKYLLIGMGLVGGQTMSASKGRGVLTKDLLAQYGPSLTRLTILLSGGNIARSCNYDYQLPETAKDMLDKFTPYFTQLVAASKAQQKEVRDSEDKAADKLRCTVESLIQEGNYRQAVTELLVIFPKRNKEITQPRPEVLRVYDTYLTILLPGFREKFILT